MTLPFSSSAPDAVQKLLGLTGSASAVEELLFGAAVVAVATWGLLKASTSWRGRRK